MKAKESEGLTALPNDGDFLTCLITSRPGLLAENHRICRNLWLSTILSDIQHQENIEGAIAGVGNDYLVYWELAGPKKSNGVASLKAKPDWSKILVPTPNRLASGLWDAWPGIPIAAGTSLNMQFRRRWD
jgi:hypothetical protein